MDAEHVLVPRLMHAALHEVGTTFEMTQEAIEAALRQRAVTLTKAHFADVFAQWTGNAAPANPFLANDWAIIDCSRVLMRGDASDQIPSGQEEEEEKEKMIAQKKMKSSKRKRAREEAQEHDERDF